MAEDWITKLGEKQVEREREHASEQAEKAARENAFEKAVAPYWDEFEKAVQDIVSAYNSSVERRDLSVTPPRTHGVRVISVARAGSNSHCQIELKGHGIVVKRMNPDHHSSSPRQSEDGVHLELKDDGLATDWGDGTPQGLARAVMEPWIGGFAPLPP